jgi:subtilisin family serine protease
MPPTRFTEELAASSRPAPEPSSHQAVDPTQRPSVVNDPSFQRSFLIIPRVDYEQADSVTTTAALAAVERAPQRTRLELFQPTKRAGSVLQKMGMLDVEKVRASGIPQIRAVSQPGQGIFARLSALGMAAAYFEHESERDTALGELGNDYEFVPNFPLSLPLRARMDQVAATKSRSALEGLEWPKESGVEAAHGKGIRGAGVLVGVVDTGIDADHREFSDHVVPYRYVPLFPDVVPSRDIRGFDTDGHGTHVSGIIAGRSVGVVPEANLYVASVIESETTRTSLLRVASGLEWLLRQFSRPENDQKPAVLNMSLGFPPEPTPGIPAQEYQTRFRVLRSLISTLIKANVLPIVAIGNDGKGRFRYPGAFKEVLAVGAVDFNGQVAPFSGSGKPPDEGVAKPDIAGYGVGVYSSVERTIEGWPVYQRFNGTSMATPYVVGIASLYRCEHPTWPVADIWKKLEDAALHLQAPTDRVGAGLARYQSSAEATRSTGTTTKSNRRVRSARRKKPSAHS